MLDDAFGCIKDTDVKQSERGVIVVKDVKQKGKGVIVSFVTDIK